MKPATPFQKMRERRIEREQKEREVAAAAAVRNRLACQENLEAVRSMAMPPHKQASNYQECMKVFANVQDAIKQQSEWRPV